MCGMCIRGCPVCYCVDCILTKKRKEKNINKETYQLTRIAHVADRCVECGNCDNNCPTHLPLSLYFQSLNDSFKEKFGYKPIFNSHVFHKKAGVLLFSKQGRYQGYKQSHPWKFCKDELHRHQFQHGYPNQPVDITGTRNSLRRI